VNQVFLIESAVAFEPGNVIDLDIAFEQDKNYSGPGRSGPFAKKPGKAFTVQE